MGIARLLHVGFVEEVSELCGSAVGLECTPRDKELRVLSVFVREADVSNFHAVS